MESRRGVNPVRRETSCIVRPAANNIAMLWCECRNLSIMLSCDTTVVPPYLWLVGSIKVPLPLTEFFFSDIGSGRKRGDVNDPCPRYLHVPMWTVEQNQLPLQLVQFSHWTRVNAH